MLAWLSGKKVLKHPKVPESTPVVPVPSDAKSTASQSSSLLVVRSDSPIAYSEKTFGSKFPTLENFLPKYAGLISQFITAHTKFTQEAKNLLAQVNNASDKSKFMGELDSLHDAVTQLNVQGYDRLLSLSMNFVSNVKKFRKDYEKDSNALKILTTLEKQFEDLDKRSDWQEKITTLTQSVHDLYQPVTGKKYFPKPRP